MGAGPLSGAALGAVGAGGASDGAASDGAARPAVLLGLGVALALVWYESLVARLVV